MKKWIIVLLVMLVMSVLGGGCYKLTTYQYEEVIMARRIVGADTINVTIATKDWRGHTISTREEVVTVIVKSNGYCHYH